MRHLNSFSSLGRGNLNKNVPKIQMLGVCMEGGMLKLRFDRYKIVLMNLAVMRTDFSMFLHTSGIVWQF